MRGLCTGHAQHTHTQTTLPLFVLCSGRRIVNASNPWDDMLLVMLLF
jgi:pyruvate/2-oxoglutarate/acetoin dehydrogenase E1 component